jgi:uncharacterized protein (TIGR02996 family)
MPTEADLLAAIDANPDDDAPRLAHADWLENNGQTGLAAFIREQLAGRWTHEKRWVAGLPCVPGMEWGCWRGYPEKVTFSSAAGFRKGWPLTEGRKVRYVEFSCLRGGAKLAAEPALADMERLSLSFLEPDVVLAILASPHLGRLRHLALAPYPSTSEFVVQLAALPVLARLRSLEVCLPSQQDLREEHVVALVNSPHLVGLRGLCLRSGLDAGAMNALWQPSSLRELTALELFPPSAHHNGSWGGGLDGLGDGAALPALERFRFGYQQEGEENIGVVLARATQWGRLRVLGLSGTNCGDIGTRALANCSHLTRLERLDLSHCEVSDAGAAALSRSPGFPSLTTLDLSHGLIGLSGVSALGRSEALPRLRQLHLAYNPAPAALLQAVETRFRKGGPPLEETLPAEPACPAPDAPTVGDADEDGLIRAIWADPFDELPRRVYADWLQEQGLPDHAALLGPANYQRPASFNRIVERMRKDAPVLFTPFLSEEGLLWVTIHTVALRSKAFKSDGPAWMRRHHVSEVQPEGTTRDWAGFFAAGWLAHVRGLTFRDRAFDSFKALAASTRAAGLASLVLGPNIIRSPGAVDLFAGTHMRGLCRLLFVSGVVCPDTMRALADAPFADHLRNLALGGLYGVTTQTMSVLANSPALGGVVTLTLPRGHLGTSEIKALADSPCLRSLRNLDLGANRFPDPAWAILGESPLLPGLRRLRLDMSGASQAVLEKFARAVASTPSCRLVLAGKVEAAARKSLAEILGERLTVE